ncbi:MAG: penicillin-binding protein 2 [Alphaproteobacteria bacterium]
MLDKEIANTFDRRSALFLTGGAVLTSVLILRMLQLQLFEYKKYKQLSLNNSSRIIIDPSERGKILSSDGAALAKDEAVYRAFIIPDECDDVSVVLKTISVELKLTAKEIEKILKKIETQRRFQPIIVRENIKWAQLATLKSLNLSGLHLEPGYCRKYPGGGLAAHVIGYVGTLDDSRTNQRVAATSPFLMTGLSGLEKVFEASLSGRPGQIITHTNAVGRIIEGDSENRVNAIPGKDLQITIRQNVQKKMEDALAVHGSGCGVALECETGKIIAMASTPKFDANIFRSIDGADYIDQLRNNKLKPFMNKAIEGMYPPGSTFKIVVALAALESGAITKDEKIFCDGDWEYGKHIYHCWEKKGHGWMNMESALAHSCDIYFYQVALRIGINPIKSMAEKLGLGQKLLDLLPREMIGVIPDREWKQKNIRAGWMHGDTIISGIGQGYILSNCLQLAVMGARAATNRKIMPYLIDGTNKEQDFKKLDLNPENIKIVMNGLARVTQEGGTAAGVSWVIKNMGGKTGTSQVRRISLAERKKGIKTNEELNWEQRNHGLFVGLAPIEKPKYSIAIITEHSGTSGLAAQAAAQTMKEALKNG